MLQIASSILSLFLLPLCMTIDTAISNYITFAALIHPCCLHVAMDVKNYNH